MLVMLWCTFVVEDSCFMWQDAWKSWYICTLWIPFMIQNMIVFTPLAITSGLRPWCLFVDVCCSWELCVPFWNYIAPENWWLEDEFPAWNSSLLGAMLVSGSVTSVVLPVKLPKPGKLRQYAPVPWPSLASLGWWGGGLWPWGAWKIA